MMNARLAEHVPMTCQEIMKTSVKRVSPNDTIFTAARIMRERDIGFLPVCDSHDRVVGVLTDRDIVVRVCAAGCDHATTTVGDVMSKDVVSCKPTQTLSRVETLMRTHQRMRVVVTDGKHKLLGVISLSDISQYEEPERAAATLAAIATRKYAR